MAGFGDEEVLGSSYPDTQVLLPLLAHVLLHGCVHTIFHSSFHGGAPNRGAVFLSAESYGAVRCEFRFLIFVRCGAVRYQPHRTVATP